MSMKILFHAAKNSLSAARFYHLNAALSKSIHVTVQEVVEAHGIRLIKDMVVDHEKSDQVNIKEGRFVDVLKAAADYQLAVQDSYGQDDVFDGSDCEKPLDPFDIHCAEMASQKVQEALARMHGEGVKLNIKVHA